MADSADVPKKRLPLAPPYTRGRDNKEEQTDKASPRALLDAPMKPSASPTISLFALLPHLLLLRLHRRQPLADPFLHTFLGRKVPLPSLQIFRQAFHLRDLFFKVVGVLVAGPITQIFHQACRS